MIRHFFLDKTNTITKGSTSNMGLNPIMRIGYGNDIMRGLIHFDLNKVRELINDKTFADESKLHFSIKMTNCFSVDGLPYEKEMVVNGKSAQRAASFDLMLMELPQPFDRGRGYEYASDMWIHDRNSVSDEGSTWYWPNNGNAWRVDDGKINLHDPDLYWPTVVRDCDLDGGILPFSQIEEEWEKYLNGEDSIIVGAQHFDFGNENLNIDITSYVKKALTLEEKKNYGLCLMMVPEYEMLSKENTQCVDFFTDNTNTFFHPFIECLYDEYINDDREKFVKGRKNRLYLYTNTSEEAINLDSLPTCEIDGVSYQTKQSTKGVYYAEIEASNNEMGDNAINYDKWSNLALNGVSEGDVEMEFVSIPTRSFIHMGEMSTFKTMVVPSVFGINDNEKVHRGEIREVVVDFRKKYTTDKKELIEGAEYRLYIKDANREISVIDYQPVEKAFLNNFFMIYTEDLIPNEYYIDIRLTDGREKKYFKNVLHFTIVSDVTERYQ